MSFKVWFRGVLSKFRQPNRHPVKVPRRPSHLHLEVLEDRLVPSADLLYGFAIGNKGGNDTVFGQTMATDAAGNVYVAGTFNNGGDPATNFNPGTGAPVNLSTNTTTKVAFVAEYSGSGALVWVRDFASGQSNDFSEGLGIAVESLGHVLVTGDYQNTATFGAVSLTAAAKTTHGYVTELDSTGTVVWARDIGGSQANNVAKSLAVAVDSNGFIFTTGSFLGTTKFGGATLSTHGSTNGFVTELNPAGTVVWATAFGGTGAKTAGGAGITVDAHGGVYITGSFRGVGAFGKATFTTGSSDNAFVAKLSNTGIFQWARALSGGLADGTDVQIDSLGNLYATGTFQFSTSFGTSTLTTNGKSAAYVVKMNSSGTVIWCRSFAGGTQLFGAGTHLAVDNKGNVWATGTFGYSITFGNFVVQFGSFHIQTDGHDNAYFAELNSFGTVVAASALTVGQQDVVAGSGIAVDQQGHVFITGSIDAAGATFLTGTGRNEGSLTGGGFNGQFFHGNAFLLKVTQALALGLLSDDQFTVNTFSSAHTIPIVDGTSPLMLQSITGLPNGVTAKLTGTILVLSGTPTATGTFNNIQVSVKDAKGSVATASYRITVNP